MKKINVMMAALVSLTTISRGEVDLPLKTVVLFDSGVGYFERQAEVSGENSAQLSFTADQLSDVIKSLVFLDDHGGKVSAVTYDARDPLSKTLKSFRIDLGDNPDRATLLNRLRGVPVRIKTTGQDYVGRVMGVEKRERILDEQKVQDSYLNISTDVGIQSFNFDEVQRVDILDTKIKADLEDALKVLAQNLDETRKTLRLNFAGDGTRKIRFGYILEAPIWKTSYRLDLSDGKVFLQGWAHVENVTDEDWKDVQLTLVSGRPLSFIQNLYDPIYVSRPVVQMETYGSIAPPVYEADLEMDVADMSMAKAESASVVGRMRANRSVPKPSMQGMAARLDESQLQSVASTKESGELFQYAITEPMTLPRQKSAMAPIVNEIVKGKTLSIYNQQVNEQYPLNGLELENSTSLHLKQGPITVIEDGVYAGDARIPDLMAGEKRYLSYSLDLAREVAVEHKSQPEEIVSIKIVKGTLWIEHKFVDDTLYKIKNKKQKDRLVVIEQNARSGWDLVEPAKADERTDELYRFRVNLEAGKSKEFRVREQRVDRQSLLLSNLNDQSVFFYVSQHTISSGAKDALKRMIDMKLELGKVQASIAELESSYAQIGHDQERIRSNMHEVVKTSDSYSMWERKLTEQEKEIETVQQKLEQLRATASQKQNELDSYLANLTIE